MSLSELNGSSLASYLTGVIQSAIKITKDERTKATLIDMLIKAHESYPITNSAEWIAEFEQLKQTA